MLKQYLQPLGYRYDSKLSDQSGFTLRKQSPQNYLLEFFADASPRAGQFSSSLSVETVFTRFNIDIQLPPHGREYPINRHLPEVIQNVAFVVKVLEETCIPKIEAVLGASPAWFTTL